MKPKIPLLSPGCGILTSKRAINCRENKWGLEKKASGGLRIQLQHLAIF